MTENLNKQQKGNLSNGGEAVQIPKVGMEDTGEEHSEEEKKEKEVTANVIRYIQDGEKLPRPIGVKDLKPTAKAVDATKGGLKTLRNVLKKPELPPFVTQEDMDYFERWLRVNSAVLLWVESGSELLPTGSYEPNGTAVIDKEQDPNFIHELPEGYIEKE